MSTAPTTETPDVARARLSRPAAFRCALAIAGLALWELVLLVWVVLTAALTLLWVGGYLVPGALRAVRAVARRQRRLAAAWTGTEVAEYYRPLDEVPTGTGALPWRRLLALVRDPATGRDLVWVTLDPVVGLVLGLIPVALILEAVWGFVLLAIWRTIVDADGTQWFLFVPVSDERTARIAAAVGILSAVCGYFVARPVIAWHARWVKAVLSPSSRSLERRVEELSQSRADVVDDASREVRRIERDLHDGAQARIVAMGMNLSAVERLMDDDPEAARAMLAEAKASSSEALRELRELVRGVHPPILADRGLVDALRARAIETPVPVTVTSTLDGRLSEPVESAVYFAVSELLTNVVKHAHAQAVTVDLSRSATRPPVLTVVVRDDGAGGADANGGTGLRGVERRLAAFDGTLRVESPVGGPTIATIRLPLAE